jgi:uncharacterized lipoprotein YddW (UPF0748 family)
MSLSLKLSSVLVVSAVAQALSGCDTIRSSLAPVRAPQRAMWVTRFDYKAPEDIDKIVLNCKSAGIDTILFQVRGNGTAAYRSSYEPWSEQFGGVDPGYDPLAHAIQAAHASGLRLCAWVNVMPGWGYSKEPPKDPNQLYNKHADWFWYDQKGNRQPLSDNFYVSLNPCLPEVRHYLVDLLTDIVGRYSIDGLHLDYMRFPNEAPSGTTIPPGTDYPRDKRTVGLFKADTGKTPETDKKAWDDWRTTQVTNLLRDIRLMVNTTRPGAELSCAVGVLPESALSHFQDSRTWVKDDLVDAVYPMNYTNKWDDFHARIDTWRAAADRGQVVMGVRIDDDSDTETTRSELAAASQNFRGFAVYAYSSIFDSRNTQTVQQDRDALIKREERRKELLPILRDFSNGQMRKSPD